MRLVAGAKGDDVIDVEPDTDLFSDGMIVMRRNQCQHLGAARAQVSDDVVKIGVLTDMAGVTADITGKGSVVAAEMAVKEFGSTVLGKPIQILAADHQHKADVGLTIARQQAERLGGSLALVDITPGACFELTLPLDNKENNA